MIKGKRFDKLSNEVASEEFSIIAKELGKSDIHAVYTTKEDGTMREYFIDTLYTQINREACIKILEKYRITVL